MVLKTASRRRFRRRPRTARRRIRRPPLRTRVRSRPRLQAVRIPRRGRQRNLRRPHRRPPRRSTRALRIRRPWWWRLSPAWVVWVREGGYGPEPPPPRWVNMPELRRFSRAARRALGRQGLLADAWLDRLAAAGRDLVRFVNRFYGASGFQHVVRDYFGGRYRRRLAQLAMRLAERLSTRGDVAQSLRFARSWGVAPRGFSVRATEVVHNGRHYLLNPWPRVDERAFGRLLARSHTLYGDPDAVRWIFDGRRLSMESHALLRTARRYLEKGSHLSRQERERWLRALPAVVMVV